MNYGAGQVQVPLLISATAHREGNDLVARIPQQGVQPYHLVRAQIQGPQVDSAAGYLFKIYRGTMAPDALISSTNNGTQGQAQFTPPEFIATGNDLLGVWENQGTYSGIAVFTVTTDGGDT